MFSFAPAAAVPEMVMTSSPPSASTVIGVTSGCGAVTVTGVCHVAPFPLAVSVYCTEISL